MYPYYPAYHPFCYQIVISIDNSRDESRRGFSWKILPVSTKPDRYDDECQSFLIANLLPLHRPVQTEEWQRHSCPFSLPLSAGSFSIIRTFEKSEPLTNIPLCRRNYIFKGSDFILGVLCFVKNEGGSSSMATDDQIKAIATLEDENNSKVSAKWKNNNGSLKSLVIRQ